MAGVQSLDMFRPPIAHGVRSLDRSFFQKTISLKAARVFEKQNISKIRSQLQRSRDALQQDRLGTVFPDPDTEKAASGMKCILLRPEMDDQSVLENCGSDQTKGVGQVGQSVPHSAVLSHLVEQGLVSIIPYDLHLDYSYWTYHDIISSILPKDAQDEIPSGFSQVDHIAHLNLRDEYLPYKSLIAEIIRDKNIGVRTVINKIDDVGEENEFRTFRYEVLAGEDDMNVVVNEENCIFRFNYARVYWNPRLQTEHRRLVSLFCEGEAVCDLMAGIGPFAIPAAKKGCFVWANDLNPESHRSLEQNVTQNRVENFVKPFNENAREFIHKSAERLGEMDYHVDITPKVRRRHKGNDLTKNSEPQKTTVRKIQQPKTFQHYILNLPASAITFVNNFVGLYGSSHFGNLPSDTVLPIIHVYCFSTKDEIAEAEGTDEGAEKKICAEISSQLSCKMITGRIEDGGVEIHNVRDVAPKKRMFCASFRLPREVAFRKRE